MRPPASTYFVHTTNTIAFGPVGTLELSLAQVEHLHAIAMRRMLEAAILCRRAVDDLDFDLFRWATAKADRESAAERTFRAAMEDHRRARQHRRAA